MTPVYPVDWPGTAELRLTVSNAVWSGLGDGYGALSSRTITARCVGRGRAARPREALLQLPDEHGGVSTAVPGPAVVPPGGSETVAAMAALA